MNDREIELRSRYATLQGCISDAWADYEAKQVSRADTEKRLNSLYEENDAIVEETGCGFHYGDHLRALLEIANYQLAMKALAQLGDG